MSDNKQLRDELGAWIDVAIEKYDELDQAIHDEEMEEARQQAAKEVEEGVEVNTTELKDAVYVDQKKYELNQVRNALVPTPVVQESRYLAYVPETGQEQPVQALVITDDELVILSHPVFMDALKKCVVDKMKYEKNLFDCEDFARKTVGWFSDLGINSVGRVFSFSGGHSFNIALYRDKNDNIKHLFFEPQTDQIITEMTGQYDLSNCLIIIS